MPIDNLIKGDLVRMKKRNRHPGICEIPKRQHHIQYTIYCSAYTSSTIGNVDEMAWYGIIFMPICHRNVFCR